MKAVIKTQWHDRGGGYWEAQAYTPEGEQLRSRYATMYDERDAVAELVSALMSDGYTEIVCESREPIALTMRNRVNDAPGTSQADRREAELCVVMAWGVRAISIEDASRALGLTRDELMALELEAIGRGVEIAKEAAD